MFVVVCLLVGTAPFFAPSYQILRRYSRKWWWMETKNLRYILGKHFFFKLFVCSTHLHSLSPQTLITPFCFSDHVREPVHAGARTHWALQNYTCNRKQCPLAKLLTCARTQQCLQWSWTSNRAKFNLIPDEKFCFFASGWKFQVSDDLCCTCRTECVARWELQPPEVDRNMIFNCHFSLR